jgi:hypothetical protein
MTSKKPKNSVAKTDSGIQWEEHTHETCPVPEIGALIYVRYANGIETKIPVKAQYLNWKQSQYDQIRITHWRNAT